MVALLGTSDLDYLSDLRTKDPKGDVHLNIKLGVRCLRSASTVIHLEKGPTKGSAASAVIQARPTRGSQALVGEGHDGFVKTTTVPLQVSHRIPGNDWTHDFAPKFGLGRFIVFEIPQPSIVGAGPIEQRAALALDAARKSEALLGEGKWAEACTALRPAWELLRDSTDVEDLLVKEGYTGAAATAFDQATNQLFQFASKFMHALDKHANVIANPDIRASKEEAQLVFVTAMGFINLIAQKLRKLK